MNNDLTDTEVAMLELERKRWKYVGAREQQIRDQFGLSPAAHAQALNLLIDRPAALAHDPQLVRRLQRLRVGRAALRAARRLDFDLSVQRPTLQ